MSALGTLLLAGCTREKFGQSGEGDGDVQTSYLSVNIVSSDIDGTRALAGYEDGTEAESKISMIRFYFFTETGAPANVKLQGTSYVNYYDWVLKDEDQTKETQTDNVSHILKATIVINTKDGDKLPRKIVAVVNPTESIAQSRSLKILKDLTNDYAKSELTKGGKFVMFNSVYVKDGEEISAVSIASNELCNTPEEARLNPVIIHVERNVAKVSVELTDDADLTAGKIKMKDTADEDLKISGKQVYLKINGWRLTSETDNGRLGKEIDLSWAGTWMNMSTRYRSCWAINAKGAKNTHCAYDDIKGAIGTAVYTNENAEYYTENETTDNLYHTKVILSGTLLDEDNNPFTIVRHMGSPFADEYDEDESKNLLTLKQQILRQLTTNDVHYYYDDKVNGRTQIGVADLKIVIAEQVQTEESKNNCYVYAQLTEDAKKKTWYTSMDDTAKPIDNASVIINETLSNKEKVDWALVWREGMTYYYYEIDHNGTGDNATKGVVRNHVYKTKVTKIGGLGTPVYDPTQIIYPEKPNPNGYYIAAQINILAWHIVNSEYQLVW